MALQGTIGDFGLPDILQLIGIQRKTGTLRLTRNQETVSVKFLEGDIVEADHGNESVEDRLGSVLVRTGRIDERQLDEALKIQGKTLQRLGHILVKQGAISEEQLVEALRVQSLQIIYRLFRWREGQYAFEAAKDIDYDDRHFAPIGAETILMEGARMVDEWPLIERRIRSDHMVLRRVGAGGAAEVGAEAAPPNEGLLTEEELRVLRLVDGKATVQQINDHSNLGEFDTYRILADLVTKKLLEEVEVVHAAQRRASTRVLERMAGGALLALAALAGAAALATLPANPWTPWKLSDHRRTTAELRFYASLNRLERLEQALGVFYLDAGTYPADLQALAAGGYVGRQDLLDPWGRPYDYSVSPGGYSLSGLDAAGRPAPELAIAYRFSPAQQMMMSGAAPTE